MYLYSTEVRWFFQGRLSENDPLISWFTKPLGGYERKPEDLWMFEGEDATNPRVDAYLLFDSLQTVGAKLRGGEKETSLEIKAQATAPAPFHLEERINGRVDSWVKWSFKHNALNNALDPIRQTGRWIRIAKDRWLRKINADGPAPRFVVADAKAYKTNPALGKLPDHGCNFELTQLYVYNDRQNSEKAWYTICLEAFGPGLSGTPQVLNACAKLAFKELGLPPGLKLSESNSLSYPAWFPLVQG